MVEVLSDLKNAGHDIILVSSGAVGVGVGSIGLQKRRGRSFYDIITLDSGKWKNFFNV